MRVTIKSFDGNEVTAEIPLTLSVDSFLATGSFMGLSEEEILYYVPVENYLKDRALN